MATALGFGGTTAGALAAGADAGALAAGCVVASIGKPELSGCKVVAACPSRLSVATRSGSLIAAAVLEPALALFGPTCNTRVCNSPLGSGTALVLADCEPELGPGSSIGTKITASAINTTAPSKRVFKPESMGDTTTQNMGSVELRAPARQLEREVEACPEL